MSIKMVSDTKAAPAAEEELEEPYRRPEMDLQKFIKMATDAKAAPAAESRLEEVNQHGRGRESRTGGGQTWTPARHSAQLNMNFNSGWVMWDVFYVEMFAYWATKSLPSVGLASIATPASIKADGANLYRCPAHLYESPPMLLPILMTLYTSYGGVMNQSGFHLNQEPPAPVHYRHQHRYQPQWIHVQLTLTQQQFQLLFAFLCYLFCLASALPSTW
ncbi:hypothetical protein EDC01DRAFT_781335 [Geopyxis carbonaria]|nr:hypothetical protein EDC01DRAFT_781335 [Geopyxis carbonaria]